ncbi:MAG: hypothetical protein ABFR90_01730 [Planctomycetota bacterium]
MGFKLRSDNREIWQSEDRRCRTNKKDTCNFEVLGTAPSGLIDRVQWGPIATDINQTVGEVIGVLRNDQYAIGLQVLNVKPLAVFHLIKEGRKAVVTLKYLIE